MNKKEAAKQQELNFIYTSAFVWAVGLEAFLSFLHFSHILLHVIVRRKKQLLKEKSTLHCMRPTGGSGGNAEQREGAASDPFPKPAPRL